MYKVVLVAVVCLNVYSYGDNLCKVPNGNAGRCVNIVRCKPLWDLHNKKRKTPAEDMFIRQSFCGYRNSPTLSVCCPSLDVWPNFQANPIIYHNPLNDLSGDTYYPTTQVNVAKETKEDNSTVIPNKSPTESATTPIPITNIINIESGTSPTPVTTIIKTESATSPVPITNIIKTDSETTPIPVTTKTEPTINEVLPLSRDSPNVTNSMSNTNEDDASFSLSISNRNNKMTCGIDDAYGGNRITGGFATAIDEYPWLVLLEYASGALSCGGSLITPRFVLTAAHCAKSRVHGTPAFVRLSEYNTTSFPTDIVEVDGGGFEELNVTVIAVENAWPHPNYTYISFVTDELSANSHDIGLVKLVRDAEFNDYIDVICLPPKDLLTEFNEGLYLTVAGWGDDNLNPDENDVKKHVNVPYVPLNKCRTLHSRNLVDTQMCAGGEKDKDSCVGDSGGPLMYQNDRKYYLVGIVSYGSVYCGTKGQPGIYTNVHKYQKWISDIVSAKV